MISCKQCTHGPLQTGAAAQRSAREQLQPPGLTHSPEIIHQTQVVSLLFAEEALQLEADVVGDVHHPQESTGIHRAGQHGKRCVVFHQPPEGGGAKGSKVN